MLLTAVLLALAATALFALGSALQHREAGDVSPKSTGRLIVELARRPGWLAGTLCSAAAFGFQAWALKVGAISVVQPILLSGIVFSVVARAALDRRLPSRGDVGWVILTWAGLAVFVLSLPRTNEQPARTDLALIVVGVGLVAGLVAVLLARRIEGSTVAKGVLLATASGILFGLVAGLIKLSVADLAQGLGYALSRWAIWGLVVVGLAAVLLNQRAYQQSRISVSTPVLNIAQLLVSLTFGVVVLDEQLLSSPLRAIPEVVGLAVMLLGVSRLALRASEARSSERSDDSTPADELDDEHA